MKKIRWNLAITCMLLAVTTIISFCFFHFGNKYIANIMILYTDGPDSIKTSRYFWEQWLRFLCIRSNYFCIPLFPIKI